MTRRQYRDAKGLRAGDPFESADPETLEVSGAGNPRKYERHTSDTMRRELIPEDGQDPTIGVGGMLLGLLVWGVI